jgi:hypothetical protein
VYAFIHEYGDGSLLSIKSWVARLQCYLVKCQVGPCSSFFKILFAVETVDADLSAKALCDQSLLESKNIIFIRIAFLQP